jgi:hypothetical protein
MLMFKSGLLRSAALALVLAVPVLAGCGGNPFTPPIDDGGGLPPNTPLNDTPQNTLLRFEATYENQVIAEYEKLFTSNFRFTFSNQSDPELVTQYGNTWGKDDEVESTSHLFNGFTNELGEFQGPASAIALSLDGASFIDDPSRPDSAAFYKYVIVPSVNLNITIAGGEEFQISAPHDFYLVRGDVALLDPAQEARADRWYIYRWDDKSAPLAAGATRLATHDASGGPARTTWGSLRARYW